MSLPSRRQKPIRLTYDQEVRLQRAAKSRGQTQQAFALGAIIRAVEETESEAARHKKQPARESRGFRRIEEPAGLGLRRPAREEDQAPDSAVLAPAPVIVQVGSTLASAKAELVSRMADYVAAGRAYDRDKRLRTAVESLRAFAKGDEERRELAKELDAAVEARIKERPGGFAGIANLASDAFDKLRQLG